MPSKETVPILEHSPDSESTKHDLAEWEQSLLDLTDRLDTLLGTEPDVMRHRVIEEYTKKKTTRVDLASLSGRQTINDIEISRESHEDGRKRYQLDYRVMRPKEEAEPYPDDLKHGRFDTEVETVEWDIQPDGTLQEDLIPWSDERFQIIASRLAELENSEPRESNPEDVTWPTPIDRARAFARRVFRAGRSK